MNFNGQIGIEWTQWLSDPNNKKLYEWNRAEAMKKFRRDENEFIESNLLEQKMAEDRVKLRQRALADLIREVTNYDLDQLNSLSSTGNAAAGSTATAGGWDPYCKGIGNYAIGTHLQPDKITFANAVPEKGYQRFTVN